GGFSCVSMSDQKKRRILFRFKMFCSVIENFVSKEKQREKNRMIWSDKKRHSNECLFLRFERSEKRVLSYLDTYRNNVIFILVAERCVEVLVCMCFKVLKTLKIGCTEKPHLLKL